MQFHLPIEKENVAMGIQQMVQSLKFNKHQKGERNKLFDSKNASGATGHSYGTFEDHKKMNAVEFAEFQKEFFKKQKQERRRYRIAILITILLTLLTILLFLFIWEQLGAELFEFGSRG